MAAAAVPALLKFGAPIAGSLVGKLLNRPSAGERAGMAGTQAAAAQMAALTPQLMRSGQTALTQGAENLGAAGSYYGRILGGDRAAMREALAPEISTALDYYRGAAGKASRSLKGGARDTALAELDRQKVGNLAMMTSQARQNAAAGAERVGGAQGSLASSLFGQGVSAGANAGWINNYLFNQGQQLRAGERDAGRGFGGIIYDILSGFGWGDAGSRGLRNPGSPMTPPGYRVPFTVPGYGTYR